MFLQLSLAQILEGEGQPIADLLVNRVGDEHAARRSQRFRARRDVDAVPLDARLVVDDVTQVDADAEEHPALLRHVGVARGHDGLDRSRALRRAHHAREFGEDPHRRRCR
jgi:hypothetical protein